MERLQLHSFIHDMVANKATYSCDSYWIKSWLHLTTLSVTSSYECPFGPLNSIIQVAHYSLSRTPCQSIEMSNIYHDT